MERGLGHSMDIPEKMIRYAMANTKSNRSAAEFLRVAYNTYKKYAKYYIDSDSGKSLFDLHKNMRGLGISKGSMRPTAYKRLKEVIAGYCPDYPSIKLKERLVRESILEEKCNRCGFCERRILDYKIPLLMDWKDGDRTNHRLDNLQLLCYNCYYLTVDNVVGKRMIIPDNI
jgi:hypothetical protein